MGNDFTLRSLITDHTQQTADPTINLPSLTFLPFPFSPIGLLSTCDVAVSLLPATMHIPLAEEAIRQGTYDRSYVRFKLHNITFNFFYLFMLSVGFFSLHPSVLPSLHTSTPQHFHPFIPSSLHPSISFFSRQTLRHRLLRLTGDEGPRGPGPGQGGHSAERNGAGPWDRPHGEEHS